MLKFSQTDVNQLLKEKEAELEAQLLANQRELDSKLEEQKRNLDVQKRKCAELSTEKLKSDEKVIRLQKSHEDMKYVAVWAICAESVCFI